MPQKLSSLCTSYVQTIFGRNILQLFFSKIRTQAYSNRNGKNISYRNILLCNRISVVIPYATSNLGSWKSKKIIWLISALFCFVGQQFAAKHHIRLLLCEYYEYQNRKYTFRICPNYKCYGHDIDSIIRVRCVTQNNMSFYF